MTSKTPDSLRQAVYRAEDQWSTLMDRGGHIDFFGSSITAPVQLRFGNMNDVRVYVDRVCRVREIPAIQVRHRRGGTRAHYEVRASGGVIAVPTNQPWAMRESVLLHEIAHHMAITVHASALHDRVFTSSMLSLVQEFLGHEAELLLRTSYQAAGVPV